MAVGDIQDSYWVKVESPFGTDQYIPRIVDVRAGQLEHIEQYDYPTNRDLDCLLLSLFFLLLLLLLGLLLAIILIPILMSYRPLTNGFPPPNPNPNNCSYPYMANTFGICVNVLIDSNNCGTIGNVCPRNWTCSAGQCHNVPGILLTNPTPIWLSAVDGSIDDRILNVTLPWNITLYNTSTNRPSVTTNGVICLGTCSTIYTETRLPSNAFGSGTAFAFWDDLYIFGNTSQGIYYQSDGQPPSRTLTFEFYQSHYVEPNQFYHFQVVFFENAPGVVQYKYYQATDGGDSCTIGTQAGPSGPHMLYSDDQPNSVQPSMSLTFNTNAGTFDKTTFTT